MQGCKERFSRFSFLCKFRSLSSGLSWLFGSRCPVGLWRLWCSGPRFPKTKEKSPPTLLTYICAVRVQHYHRSKTSCLSGVLLHDETQSSHCRRMMWNLAMGKSPACSYIESSHTILPANKQLMYWSTELPEAVHHMCRYSLIVFEKPAFTELDKLYESEVTMASTFGLFLTSDIFMFHVAKSWTFYLWPILHECFMDGLNPQTTQSNNLKGYGTDDLFPTWSNSMVCATLLTCCAACSNCNKMISLWGEVFNTSVTKQ